MLKNCNFKVQFPTGPLTLLSVAILTLAALWLVVFSIRDYDTFWHLANGRAMLEQGRIINEEIFSYSALGTEFANHSWLAQIIMYLFWAASGAVGLIVYKLIMTAAILFCTYRLARVLGASAFGAALAGYSVVFVGLSRFVARPQLFSYLGLALLAWLLFGYLRGRFSQRIFWCLPPLMLIWDFTHGAIFGYVFWGATALSETVKLYLPGPLRLWQKAHLGSAVQVRRLWFWLVLSFFLSLVKPRGLELYGAIFDVVGDDFIIAMTGEFMPTASFGATYWPFWVLLAALACCCLLCWRKLDLTCLFVLVPFVFLGVRYSRCVAVFAIVAAPLTAALVSQLLESLGSQKTVRRFTVVVSALWVFTLLGLTIDIKGTELNSEQIDPTGLRTSWGINEVFLPMGAVNFIKTADLQGNMFNSDRFGGLLAFFLSPERPIFHYNHPKIFKDIYRYLHDPSSRDKWRHNYAVIAKAEEFNMFSAQHWVTVYRDPSAMILVPNNPSNALVIQKYKIQYFDPLEPLDSVRKKLAFPTIAPTFTREIVNFLTFNRNEDYCRILVENLSKDGALPAVLGEQYVDMALRGNPESASLLGFMGLQRYRSGDIQAAISYFSKARNSEPDSRFTLINLGFIYLGQSQLDNADEAFSRLLKQNPDDAAAIYGLARVRLKEGRVALAKPLLKRYLALEPRGRFSDEVRGLL